MWVLIVWLPAEDGLLVVRGARVSVPVTAHSSYIGNG